MFYFSKQAKKPQTIFFLYSEKKKIRKCTRMVLKLVFNLVAFLINVKQPSDCQVLPDPQLSGDTASAVLLWLCV